MSERKKENTVLENTPKSEQKKKWAGFEVNNEWVNKSLPVIVMLSLAAIFYIFLVHSHVKKLSEVERLKYENQELRSELIAIQTDLMTKSKQSEVAGRVKASGLKEMREPPLKLKKNRKK